MFQIKTINNISETGIEFLKKKGFSVHPYTVAPDAILVRSENLHGTVFNKELLAIARAGSGYNNIPIDECAENGIVVFNSPGANAEAVKELELCSLVMASRDVLGSIEWVRSIAGEGDAITGLVYNLDGDQQPSQANDPNRGKWLRFETKEWTLAVEERFMVGYYLTEACKPLRKI